MTDARDAFRLLSDSLFCPDDIPDRPAPGVYAIFAKSHDCLPDIDLPQTGLVYMGRSGNLAQRNHFKADHSGFSSPRRSLGAILKSALGLTAEPRSSGRSETNYERYRFSGDGETRLSTWMRRNLMCAIYPFEGNTKSLEKRLIRENEPPLNLTGWRNPQKEKIQQLRRVCREEARLIWNTST